MDGKLRIWKPETAAEVRERVAEVIELADGDALDLTPSRSREQEVLDMLNEPSPQPGEVWVADLGLAAKTRPVVIV